MKEVFLTRNFFDEKQTLGILISDGFECKTLELPWLENKNKISCIPLGVYLVKWTKSPLFSQKAGKDVFTFEIQNVPNRGGIRIHSANYYHQLLGCIALGSSFKDINSDSRLDLIHSGKTLKDFEDIMLREEFKLSINI